MMKYIIDIPDEHESDFIAETPFGKRFCFPWRITDVSYSLPTHLHVEEYTEPDRKAIEDEVWEFVEQIECMTFKEIEDCFDTKYEGVPFVANMFSYQEAKAKYDAWKKRKDEIRVGDEVFLKGDARKEKAIVLRLYQPKMYKPIADVLWADGSVETTVLVEKLMRTDRHFDEVERLLERMKVE